MICPACDTQVTNGATFCRNCGAIVETAEPAMAVRSGPNRIVRGEAAGALRIAALTAAIGLGLASLLYGSWLLLERYAYPAFHAGASIGRVFDTWLLAHGGVDGVGMTLTAAVWIWVAVRLAVAAHTRLLGPMGDDAEIGTALGVAVAYAAAVTVAALVRYAGGTTVETVVAPRTVAAPEAIVIHSVVVIVVVSLATLQGMRRTRGASLGDLVSGRAVDRTAVSGAVRIATSAMGIATVFVIVDRFLFVDSVRGSGVDGWLPKAAQGFVVAAPQVITAGLDLGFGYLVSAMGFFSIDLYAFSGDPGVIPVRAWPGVPVIVLVFLVNGLATGTHSQRHGLPRFSTGFTAGLGFMAIAFGASGLASPNADGLTKYALLFPLAWAVIPAFGSVAWSAIVDDFTLRREADRTLVR